MKGLRYTWLATIALIGQLAHSHAQTFSVYAGTGTAGFSGDGGPCISAQLDHPWHLAIDDNNGFLYVTDFNNQRVRSINMGTTTINTYAGTGTWGFSGDGGPAVSAMLNHPTGLTVDGSGNLYIADIYNYRIRKVAYPSGIITTVAGTGTAGYSGDGGDATLADIGPANGISAEPGGALYHPDYGSSKIRKITPGSPDIIDFLAGSVWGYAGDGMPAGTATAFNYLNDVEYDAPTGNLYVAEFTGNRIRKIEPGPGFMVSTYAGTGTTTGYSTGVPATTALLNHPVGMALDCHGDMFFCDCDNHVIRKIDAATGILTTIAGIPMSPGAGTGQPGEFDRPNSLVVDAIGDIYVADHNNNRIVKLTFQTEVCVGNTVALCDKTGTGTWSTSDAMVADIDATGLVTGMAAGVATITLTLPTYYLVRTVVVNPAPAPITGPTSVTLPGTITLSDATPGGTWSSSNTGIATVDAGGNVTGVSGGVVVITYTLPGGCYVTYKVEVRKRGKCIDDLNLSVVTAMDSAGNCVFTATATVSTAYIVVGYEWTMPDGSTVITHTLATSDVQTFTVPSGGAGVVSVKVHVVRTDWEKGESPCCEMTIQKQVICDKNPDPCDTMVMPTVTCWAMQDTLPPYSWIMGFTSSLPVIVDFTAYVIDMSTSAICTLTVSVPIPAGSSIIDPCTLPGIGSCGFPCVPGYVFISALHTTAIHFRNCSWDYDCTAISSRPAGGDQGGGTSQFETGMLNVKPNPTSGSVTLSGRMKDAGSTSAKVDIVDMFGRQVYTGDVPVVNDMISSKMELANNLANGVYFIKVHGNKTTESVRFVLRR